MSNKLDLPRYLRIRALRAQDESDHLSARVYDEAATRIDALEAETKRLAARADELESWMETVLNYYPHLEDGAPTGARADAAQDAKEKP